MNLEVIWSPEAIEDLEWISDYISGGSGFYAQSVVTESFTCAERTINSTGGKNAAGTFI